jgi:WD40 repeat protein
MEPTYDVFVSHNGLDKPVVERLCWALLEAGLRPWFDKWDLAPGDVWMTEVERVLAKVPAVIVCVGEHGLSAWHDAERQAALDRSTAAGGGTVVPVLLPGAPARVELPIFLRGRQAMDLRAEPAWDDGVARLAATLAGQALRPWVDEGRERPYRGLRPFTEADAGWMFGREREEQKLLDALRDGQRFVTVVGASGSGKSSLVRAGVIPAVRTGAFDGQQRWRALVMRPGPRPCHSLAMRLLELRRSVEGTTSDLVEDGRYVDDLAERVLRSPSALADMADLLLGRDDRNEQLLLVVDQLEELFTEATAASTPAAHGTGAALEPGTKLAPEGVALLRNLLCATGEPNGRVRVILTVRADFTGECLAVPELAQRMERMSFALAPMGSEQLRAAIRRPALRVGYDVEAALVDALVQATAGVAGRLPLFQHTLDLLWDVRDKKTRRMTYAAYIEHVGSIEESVARRAETVFAVLVSASPGHEAVVRRMFMRLVHLGEGTGDTRRQMPYGDLPNDAAARSVLDAFVDARLLVTDAYRGGSGAQPEQAVEIAHEALLGRWGRLRRWLNENRETLRILQEVDLAAAEWQARGRPADELWRGGRLARAWEVLVDGGADLSLEERAFLDAAKAAEDLERRAKTRRQRWLLGAAAGASVVLSLALAVAIAQYLEAKRLADANEQLAQQEQAQAERAEQQAERAAQQAARAEAAAAAAKREQERAEDLAREEQGARASLLASIPGQELGALELGVLAVGEVSQRGLPSPQVAKGQHDALTRARKVTVLAGHTQKVVAAAWSPDGTCLATAGGDGTTRLWDAATGKPRTTLDGHAKALVSGVAWAPDGKQLATAGWDGTAQIWDADTGARRRTLTGHPAGLTAVAWRPDGARVATASLDGSARLWDPATGTALAPLEGHTGLVAALAWSPDGAHVATVSHDLTARVWDGETGTTLHTLAGHTSWVVALAWSPDGKSLATGSVDTTVRLWDRGTGEVLTTLVGHAAGVSALAWTPDGTRLATASWDETARLWLASTGGLRATLQGHTNAVSAAGWSPDGTHLATASWDGAVRLWDGQTGKPLATLHGHANDILVLAWSPDGAHLASAGLDGSARIWAQDGGETLAVLRGHRRGLRAVAWSPDGSRVVTWGGDSTVRHWEAATGEPSTVLSGFGARVEAMAWTSAGLRLATVANDDSVTLRDGETGAEIVTLADRIEDLIVMSWSPDGTRVVTGTRNGRATLWDGNTGARLDDLAGHTLAIMAAAWTPDGTRLATASADATARLWDGRTGASLGALRGHAQIAFALAWSPDGTRLATGSADGSSRIWDGRTAALQATLEGHAKSVVAVVWAPDGTRLATADLDGVARLWDVRSGDPIATLRGHTSAIEALAWMPDGTRLATASRDGTTRLWDGVTGEELVALRGHTDRVVDVAWSPDGKRVATASHDDTARLWPGSHGAWLERACDVLEGSTGGLELQAKTRAICAAYRSPPHPPR